jgi:3-oxoacyl-[acyl-carrier-protein] synthase III
MISQTLPVQILGLGIYLPPNITTNDELEKSYGVRHGWIERVTGVSERRRATYETSAYMASQAAKRALNEAGIPVENIDAIIGASTVPQQLIPCTAAFVQRELSAPEGKSHCFDINATCLSFLVALSIAGQMITSDSIRTALIYSSELTSLSLNPAEWESASLFGDAAVAAVLARSPAGSRSSIGSTRFATYSSAAELTEIRGGGSFRHPSDPRTVPEDFLFHMDGPQVFKKATVLLGPFIETFLADAGRRREDFQAVVPHQASLSGVQTLTSRYGFHSEQVILNLANRGNCIAASIPLALAEAVADGRVKRGHRILLLGTGAGLTIGAMDVVY